jgi:two-component sensor histidine kinase
MKKCSFKAILICIISILNYSICVAQIIDFKSEHPYTKVFVETDNFGASYLQILEDALPQIKSDTLKFSILNDLAYYWHTRNLPKAQKFTNRGLQLTKNKKNTLWHGRFQITQGAILLRDEKLDSAFIVLESAKNKVIESDLAMINTQLGYVFERRGKLDFAADYALEALRLGIKLEDQRAVAIAYSDLSGLFWKQSKFEKGLEYGLKSIGLFEARGINDLDYDFTLYVVGNNYLALKEYKQALNYFNHSIAIGERYGFYNNLSDVYISLIDLNAYLNQFKEAEEAGVNAVKYAKLLENNFMIMRSWLSIGKMQNLQGKFSSAIKSLEKSIEAATANFGDQYYLSQVYEALGRAYVGNHDYKRAYEAFEHYDSLKKEIFTAEADQRISLIQTELDVAQKETTIQTQGTKIEQQKSYQTLIIVIACLLFILLSVLYITYKKNENKNKLLLIQNKEKEFLLKEIHHRVKNNLEIVSSILALQSEKMENKNAIDALQESQNRVQSMSMIHQKLYQGENLGTIEMKDYFINLGSYILDSFGAKKRITIKYVMETLELDVDTAVPLGLIVNELLTNALKYAFPKNKTGTITIGLKKKDKDTLQLEIADNGIGKKGKADNGTGFGTQLIALLTQQLSGTMTRKSKDGTFVSFVFKPANVS